jgi:hypothetical protein
VPQTARLPAYQAMRLGIANIEENQNAQTENDDDD